MSSYKKQAVQYSPCKRQNGFLEWRNEFQDYCQNLGMALFRPYTEKIYYWNSKEKDRYSVSWGSVHKKSGSPIRCLEKIIMLLWYHNERYSLNKPSGSKEAWPFASTKRLMLKATEGLHWDYWACFFLNNDQLHTHLICGNCRRHLYNTGAFYTNMRHFPFNSLNFKNRKESYHGKPYSKNVG